MSNAHKVDLDHDTGHDQSQEDERRSQPDSKLRDRRIIARMSDPELRLFMSQLHKFCMAWVVVASVYIAALVGIHFWESALARTRSIFLGVVVGVVAVLMYRLAVGIKSFLINESQGRLGRLIERCYHLFIAMTVISVLMAVVHIITLF
jgi:hypothetical protein